MKLLYMIIATFVQVLLTSFVLYTCASPVPPPIANHNDQPLVASESRVQLVHQAIRQATIHQNQAPAIPVAAPVVQHNQPEPVAPVHHAPAAKTAVVHAATRQAAPVVAHEQHQPEQLTPKKAVVEPSVVVATAPVAPIVPAAPVVPVAHAVPVVNPVVTPMVEVKKEAAVIHESPVLIREHHPKKQEQVAKAPVQPEQQSHSNHQQQAQKLDARSSVLETPVAAAAAAAAPSVIAKIHEVKPSKESHANVAETVKSAEKLEAKSASVEPVIAKVVLHEPVAPVAEKKPVSAPVSPVVVVVEQSKVKIAETIPLPVAAPANPVKVEAPIVKGGQGPLHLLAATLCSYQPDRPTGDEQISSLYAQRASLRKSLFDFMSLKFTNLEKLSSRLNSGLEVMPPKPFEASNNADNKHQHHSLQQPTHGWPVVGKCTAHDLRLMAEAAWCECTDSANCEPIPKGRPSSNQVIASSVPVIAAAATVSSSEQAKPAVNEHKMLHKRSIEELASLLPSVDMVGSHSSPNSPLIVPKLVDSIINQNYQNNQIEKQQAAFDQRALSSLNLTQQQYSAIQVQAGLTQECKRNALRLSKALFQHLAEDQSQQSESWPKLYAQLQEDECARKRLIDIVTALSGYRTEASSIRRDNVEFAFAMDDLRSKVLESEVTAPLTFDRHFIEVEQFLQQSVKLMLANIDPERAKLTSMRYRSLMPAPLSADDQCVQLHQLLLAKTHPQECNPNQYGQLPDILRMAANSLALWSIESELSKLGAARNLADVHPISVSGNSNECIANLVSS